MDAEGSRKGGGVGECVELCICKSEASFHCVQLHCTYIHIIVNLLSVYTVV
jgi:hypothetical protein